MRGRIIIKFILSLAILIGIQFSTLNAQEVTVSVQDVLTSSSGDPDIGPGQVKVKIYLTSSVPIHSYSFTLEGFDNILSASTEDEPSDIIAGSALNFGSENIHIFGNYFYGGSLMEDVSELIDPADGGLFLSILADYNYDENYDYDGYFLTFDEILPGVNNQGTNFFTYDEEEDSIYPVAHEWIRTTWLMGENGVHSFIGEDCNGDILGLSVWDDCGTCTEGSTGVDYNSDSDCMGNCFGDAVSLSYWYDNDGDGFGGGESEEICNGLVESGWVLNGDDDDDDCFAFNEAGEHQYDCAGECNGDSTQDECGVCDNDSLNDSFFNSGDSFGGAYDCSGECFGLSQVENWYADCDLDGQADNPASLSICGLPTDSDLLSLCPEGNGNLLSIDPNNHSFDPHPNCTSNQVDECDQCDGPGVDCRGTCSPNSPKSLLSDFFCWSENGEGYGIEMELVIENSSSGQDTTIVIAEGCRSFIGYGSDFEFSHDNGVDLCGECYIGDIIGGDDYNSNYSCKGCTDVHAGNYDAEATFSDGSCFYQLYAGDVNQDGIVNELDIDGIAVFWNHWTYNGRIEPNIDWSPQFSQGDTWFTAEGYPMIDEACPMFADTNGDAIVESADITAILNNWGKQVDEQYYYPWGINGEGPGCLESEYDQEQLRDNYSEIYDYITDNCPCDSDNEEIIQYLANLLGYSHDINYIPDNFKVHQNIPNPFNPITQFPIDISVQSDVTLKIYNINGSLIHENKIKSMNPGSYQSNSPFRWNAANFSSGVYIYSFELSTGEIAFNKLMLIK